MVSDSLPAHGSPGSSVHGILQARILEWVAILFSRRSSWPRDQTQVSHVAGRFFAIGTTKKNQFDPYSNWNNLLLSPGNLDSSLCFIQPCILHDVFCIYTRWTFLVAQMVKRLPAMQETRVRFLGWEDPLEKEMAIHSSTLAWKIPWMEEPDRLQPSGLQRVRHDWATSLSSSVEMGKLYISGRVGIRIVRDNEIWVTLGRLERAIYL